MTYTERFGLAGAYITKATVQLMRDLGAIQSPQSAYYLKLGLESLHVRMPRHCENAQKVAEFLQQHENVSWVQYCGLPGDKYYELGQKYLPHGSCGVVSFGVKGGRAAAETVMGRLKVASIETHVADSHTCCLHPASTTHRQMNAEELQAAGVREDLIRYSCGLEDAEVEFTYVQQNMPLAAAGVVAGDLLVSINGAPITCVADFTAYQTEHPFDGSAVTLEYEHSGKTKEITVTPVENTYANVQFSYQLREKQSPIGVLKYSVLEIKYWVRTVIDSVSMLITGQYSVNDLSGPVGVVDAIGTAYDDVKSQGVLVTVMTMLNMVILLSSNLGVMNLLPLPALDGGRLVFLIIEAIRRKPIRRDLEGMVHFAGLVLLMALMVYVMIHDVQRIL